MSSTASAAQLHGFEFSFDGSGSTAGSFTDLGGVAIHQGTGTVYAVDRGNGVIDKFDASGTPQNFSALGSSSLDIETVCPNFQLPPGPGGANAGYYHGRDGIAVDSTGGAADGAIYLTTDSVDPGAPPGTQAGICAIDSTGNLLWRDTEAGGTGIVVDEAGHLWLGAYNSTVELDNTGSPPEVINIFPWPSERLAVDSSTACPAVLPAPASPCIYLGVNLYTLAGFQYAVQENPASAVYVNPGSNHFYTVNLEGIREYGVAGKQLLSSGGEETFSGPQGLAVRASSGRVYVSDSSNRVLVYSDVDDFAAVTTGPTTAVRRTTAKPTGEVDPDGGGNITSCHVEYGLDKTYGSSVPCDQTTPYSSPTAVSAGISGLKGGTTYHYRLFATDAAGTNRGQDQTFTTPFISDLSTGSSSNVQRNAATLNGSLDPDGVQTTFYFQWGLTTGYGNTTPAGPPGQAVGSTPGATAVTADIAGLAPATTYHYRIVGINAEGKSLGQDRTLTTSLAVKDLSTESPSEVGPDTATLNGSLDPDGFETSYHFEWGRTTAYGNVTPVTSAGEIAGSEVVSADLSDLLHYTEYHYRLIATNSFGTTVGEDVAFLSALPFLPEIAGTSSFEVKRDRAVLSAEINPGFGPTVFRFDYGTDTSYGFSTGLSAPIGDDGSFHAVSAQISDLSTGTVYHYRVVGINFRGATQGPDQTFVTSGLPLIDSVSASQVGQTTASLSALVNPDAAATTYHFEYGRDPSYGARTAESGSIASDTMSRTVTADISGLVPGTTYHFHVVATNENGTVSSGDQTLTTAPPSALPAPEVKCKRNFVRRHGKCVRTKHGKRKRHGTKHHG